LLDDEVPDIKRTIATPAKLQEMFACYWMDKTVVYEKGRESTCDFGEVGCAIDLFLDTCTWVL
jgi:hypothetical protein